MGVAERRQREREELRNAIIDAAVEIVSSQGVEALSIRGVAERIEYAPGTIYLYFENKDELLRSVVEEAARRFDAALAAAVPDPSTAGSPIEQLRALRRAYIRFALEQTAAFRLLFALPKIPYLEGDCRPSELPAGHVPLSTDCAWGRLRSAVAAAMSEGLLPVSSVDRGALALWASVHGYVTLYLAGHLDPYVDSADALIALVEATWGPAGQAEPQLPNRSGTYSSAAESRQSGESFFTELTSRDTT
jgi:AcrR family transcriptional regulator